MKNERTLPNKKLEENLPLLAGLFLFAATALLYWPATGYGYFAVDDYEYLTENPFFSSGAEFGELKGAVAEFLPDFWKPIPLTLLSFLADARLFGPTPEVYHRTNVLLHALNTLLIYMVMRRATGSQWKSFAVALIFGFHPLRVESVAWTTARKDLLSGSFFFLCLLAWERYARTGRLKWYALTGFLLALGLLSKPVLVTAPALLLVFDFWPLGRLKSTRDLKGLALEKIPFAALSAVSAAITVLSQQKSLIPLYSIGFAGRVSDAVLSYCHYLVKFLYPSGLAFLPRTPETDISAPAALFLLVLLAGATWGAWRVRKSAPFVLAGWLWYLAALLPNSGIVPVGLSFLADRYTYLPLIGISLILVWGVERLGEKHVPGKVLKAAVFLPVVLVPATAMQIPHWRDSLAMADRIEAVSGNSSYANEMRAIEYIKRGDFEKARECAEKSISEDPARVAATFYMAESLTRLEKFDSAEFYYKKAISMAPDFIPGLYNYGLLLSNTGRPSEAESYFIKVEELSPTNFHAILQLGIAYAKQGKTGKALEKFSRAAVLAPKNPETRFNLALAAADTGQKELAISEFKNFLLLSPGNADVHFNLGVLLAESGRKEEARTHFGEALRINPGDEASRRWLSRL